MRRRFVMTERRATSVGCAVKTGTISTRLSQSRASSTPIPPHLAQGAHQRPALTAGLAAQLQGMTAALAVVGLGQVDQLEVEGKGAGQ